MPLDRKLLEILVCPVTKQPVFPLSPARLAVVNRAIEGGEIHSADGEKITQPLNAALVTENGNTLYQIDGDIPVMLEGMSIACEQIADW